VNTGVAVCAIEYRKDAPDFIYTGDSALVTKENLAFMGGTKDPKIRFISRMPATFSMVDKLIGEAVAGGAWDNIGKLCVLPASECR